MEEAGTLENELEELIGREVVLDVKDPHLYIGTLEKVGQSVLVLSEADVHFSGDSLTTTELYLLEAKKNGVRPNRRRVFVMRSDVVSVSRLEDIIDY